MKSLLVAPLVALLVSLRPAPEDTCTGCQDVSVDPTTEDVQSGSCASSFTTAEMTQHSGLCFGYGLGCMEVPCTPFLRLRNHGTEGDPVWVTGAIGNTRYGPVRFRSGSDTTVYAGYTEVKCNIECSPYSFEVRTACEPEEHLERVEGSFACTSCNR
jgi:hypothetical protein